MDITEEDIFITTDEPVIVQTQKYYAELFDILNNTNKR